MKSLSLAVVLFAGVVGITGNAQSCDPAVPTLLRSRFSRLPICFIENQGLHPEKVGYYVHGLDRTIFFATDGITFRLQGWVVKLSFVDADPAAQIRGEARLPGVVSYFRGGAQAGKTGLRTYGRVVYPDLWPGIDLVYRGDVDQLKYEFRVRPGADPDAIRLRWEGATRVARTSRGGLRIETPAGCFEDAPPVAWQDIRGRRMPVPAAFDPGTGADRNTVGFQLGAYDRDRPLVLDPAVIVYCGFLGGMDYDQVEGIAVDAAGRAYVAGYTFSTEASFPVKVGPDLVHHGSGCDAFVARVNAAGTALDYCGYIGGSGNDWAHAVAVDSLGRAYVVGTTESTESTFPVRVGPDGTHNGGNWDAFVARVNAAGTALDYCGYIGGEGNDTAWDVAVDASGSAYLIGETLSDEQTFPVVVGPDLTHNGSADYYVAKVHPAGSHLLYCGYIGGAWHEQNGCGITVDAHGQAYVTGTTASDEQTFPVRVGPDLTFNGTPPLGLDAFVAKLSASGASLLYCGYIGGDHQDQGLAIAVDDQGAAYVAGATMSPPTTFPVKIGPDLTQGNVNDGYVAKVNPGGTALVYCGYVGGVGQDYCSDIAVDAAGRACVVGMTVSDENSFPVRGGPAVKAGGFGDAFVAWVDPRGVDFANSGFLGGSGQDAGYALALDRSGNAFMAGWTGSDSASFPVRVGPYLTTTGYRGDGFVARLNLVHLDGQDSGRPGQGVQLALTSTDDVGRHYQVASAFGTGPIQIDQREIGLSADPLLYLSTWNVLPGLFLNYSGIISPRGTSVAVAEVPDIPYVVGLTIYSAFVTLDPQAPSNVRSISNTFSFEIIR